MKPIETVFLVTTTILIAFTFSLKVFPQAPTPFGKVAKWEELTPCRESRHFACVLSDSSVLGAALEATQLEITFPEPITLKGSFELRPSLLEIEKDASGGDSASERKWIKPSAKIWQKPVSSAPEKESLGSTPTGLYTLTAFQPKSLVRLESEWDLHVHMDLSLFVPRTEIAILSPEPFRKMLLESGKVEATRSAESGHGCELGERAISEGWIEVASPPDLDPALQELVACFWIKSHWLNLDPKTGNYAARNILSKPIEAQYVFENQVSARLDWYVTVSSPLCAETPTLNCKPAPDVRKWITSPVEIAQNQLLANSLIGPGPSGTPLPPSTASETVDSVTGYRVRNLREENGKRTGEVVPRLVLKTTRSGPVWTLQKHYTLPKGTELAEMEKRNGLSDLGYLNRTSARRVFLEFADGTKKLVRKLGPEIQFNFDGPAPLAGVRNSDFESVRKQNASEPKAIIVETVWKDSEGEFTMTVVSGINE
jgi:hypothetical protein